MTAPAAVEAPLSPCGCCEGTHALTPARYDLVNQPGAPQLHYRVGTQATFLHTMQAAAAAAPALHGLQTHRVDDGAMALVDAWACALDVLSFYTERIANEGYLRTATETLSLVQLARTVGYERAPGRAATASLVFILETAPGSPEEVPILVGTKVASRPGPGEQPQTFETMAELLARPVWNTLAVADRVTYPINDATTSIYLDGTVGDLHRGDPLLIVGGDKSATNDTWALVTIAEVTPRPDLKLTRIGWDAEQTVHGKTFPPSADIKVYALRQRAALFGYNATDWRALANEVRKHFDEKGSAPNTEDGWPGFPTVTTGDSIDLDAAYPRIAEGSWMVLSRPDTNETHLYRVEEAQVTAKANFALSSKVTRVRLSDSAEIDKTYAGGRRTTVVLAESEELTVVDAPRTDPVTDKTIDLAAPVPTLPPGRQLIVRGQHPDGSTTAELVEIGEPADTAPTTMQLHLKSPLVGTYRRDSVTIWANVAPSTHGETKNEVLGSGDASIPFQRFALLQSPLTYVTAGAGVTSTLEVRVNGIRWHEVPSFIDSGPPDRVYVVRCDSEGKVSVTFGDGVHGARLPSGSENVTATYRVGVGLAGKLVADQLTMPLTRPLGLRSVTNPMPTGLAADPDPPAALRANAPLRTRTVDRVVSLTDYEDFVLSLPGFAKAQAGWRWCRRGPTVHLSVACDDGQSLSKSDRDDLISALVNAGDGYRVPDVDVAEQITFDATLEVFADPDRAPGSVAAAVRAAVLEQFGFDARGLGQPVFSSEVSAVCQRVAGVVAVTVRALHYTSAAVTVEPVLLATSASSGRGSFSDQPLPPAQLLKINAAGLTVTGLAP